MALKPNVPAIPTQFPGPTWIERLPRQIPSVSVQLDTKIRTKEHQNFVLRDLLGLQLVGNGWTNAVGEYLSSFNYRPWNSSQHVSVAPKLFISKYSGSSDLVSLGEFVILRPLTFRQSTYLEGVETQGSTAAVSVDNSGIRGNPSVQQNKQNNVVWTPQGNSVHQCRNMLGPEAGYDAFIVKELPTQAKAAPIIDQIRSSMISKFNLLRNQPFSFSWWVENHTMDATHASFVNDNKNWEGQSAIVPYAQFYSKTERIEPAIEVTWGMANGTTSWQYKVIIRRSGQNISLWANDNNEWRLLGNRRSTVLSSKKPWQDVTVYPVGRQIWIIPAAEIDHETLKNATVFDLPFDINIEPTKVTVSLYGGKQGFRWNQLVHTDKAVLLSPPVNCGIPTLENAFLNLSYFGKNSTGRDQVNAPEDINNQLAVGLDRDPVFGKAEIKTQTVQSINLGENVDYVIKYKLLTHKANGDDIFGPIGLNDNVTSLAVPFFPDMVSSQNIENENYLKWLVVIHVDPAKNNSERLKSPIIQRMELTAIAPFAVLEMNPTPQISSDDVMNLSVSESVAQIVATVVINNRHAPDDSDVHKGKYTYQYEPNARKNDPQKSNFVGVKPITIRGGVLGGSHFVSQALLDYTGYGENKEDGIQLIPIRFRGFIIERHYSRPNSGTSTVTLNCEDVSRRAKDHPTMNLPIFDGWCNLAAMYYLLRDAGYDDDEILLCQDMNNPSPTNSRTIRLYDLLVEAGNDPHSFSGPCFSGHTIATGGIPVSSALMNRAGISMSMATLHALLPLNLYRQQPNFMFSAGQNTWDCCSAIREFTGFYLYANALGNILYTPPEAQFRLGPKSAASDKRTAVRGSPPADDFAYYETAQFGINIPNGKAYNEYQRQLVNSISTEDMRNAVALFGLIPDSENNIMWTPHVIVKRPNNLKDDLAQPWFVPWLRWAIVKNPNWNDAIRNEALAEELFNRLRRTQAKINFGLWGQPGHYIFKRFKIDERVMNETGAHGLEFVTVQVTHNFDASSKKYSTEIVGEHLDFNQFDFAPHVTGTPLRTYTVHGPKGKQPVITQGKRPPI